MTPLQELNHRERQVLIHAYLYYKLNKNIVGDDLYDHFSFDLDRLIKKYPEDFKKSVFYESFKEFNPSSGYYLNYDQPWVRDKAFWLLKVTK